MEEPRSDSEPRKERKWDFSGLKAGKCAERLKSLKLKAAEAVKVAPKVNDI